MTIACTSEEWDISARPLTNALRTITKLDIPGPAARYDAGIVELADGSSLLVSGMGGGVGGVIFYADVWRFDPSTESWSEIRTTSQLVPPALCVGRRRPRRERAVVWLWLRLPRRRVALAHLIGDRRLPVAGFDFSAP